MVASKYPWGKVLSASGMLFTSAPLLWYTEARGMFGRHPLIEKYGFIALLIGAAIGTVLVAGHYWKEGREHAALQHPHESRDT